MTPDTAGSREFLASRGGCILQFFNSFIYLGFTKIFTSKPNLFSYAFKAIRERRDSNARRELAKRTLLTFLVITKDLVLSEKDPQSS